MGIVTEQELIDAAADLLTLEQVVNGAANINGTGLVTARLGSVLKTLSKIEEEIPEIASATVTAVKWAYNTTTTMSNPGTGLVRLNNATLASVTQIAVSANSAEGTNPDVSDYVIQWDDSTSTIKGYIYLKKSSSSQNYAIFAITGAITDNTTWLQIPVSFVASNGTFSASDNLYFYFSPKGDAGSLTTIGSDINMNGNQLQLSKGADIASASTLSTPTDGNYADVTGTTTITSIATSGVVGTEIRRHFDAALTLTHHATNLILPTNANILTAAGDEAKFIEYEAGKWRCVDYQRANGQALTTPPSGSLILLSTQSASNSSSIDFTSLITSSYKKYIVDFLDVIPINDGAELYTRISESNGSSWNSSTLTFTNIRAMETASVAMDADPLSSVCRMTANLGVGAASGEGLSGRYELFNKASASMHTIWTYDLGFTESSGRTCKVNGSGRHKSLASVNAIQFYFSTGSISSGIFKLYGVL